MYYEYTPKDIELMYCSLDERVRDFIASNMPEEAVQMRFEDDVYVSLNFSNINSKWCYLT